jgi:nitroreductase
MKGEKMFAELMEKRRSIKKYADRAVEPEKIDEIIESALRSPSGRAARPWHFVVVTDKGLLEKLSVSRRPLSVTRVSLKNFPFQNPEGRLS